MLRSLGIALLCLTAVASSRVKAEAPYVIVKRGDALSLIAERANISVEQLREWNRLDGDLIRIGQKLIIGQDARRPPPKAAKVHKTEPRSGNRLGSGSDDDGIDWTPPFDYAAAAAEVEMEAEDEPTPRIAARDPETAVAVRSYDKPAKKKTLRRRYSVQSGDTLAEIALRHDTTIADLLEANPGLDANRIHPGQTIDLGAPMPAVVFKLERGDTVLAAASRYGVSSRDLQR
ncbi:MAG TPA: LysM peptidoglycan-binding domain-containing protein, partial [Polyangiales bacterium]|nr:LysM peptidoglycan-binding domain-containing protein [Polyangiales bacterium]